MNLIEFPKRPPKPPQQPAPVDDEFDRLEIELMQLRIHEAKLINRILWQAWTRALIRRIVFWSFVLWLLWIISGGA